MDIRAAQLEIIAHGRRLVADLLTPTGGAIRTTEICEVLLATVREIERVRAELDAEKAAHARDVQFLERQLKALATCG
jgi:hypothetical protein